METECPVWASYGLIHRPSVRADWCFALAALLNRLDVSIMAGLTNRLQVVWIVKEFLASIVLDYVVTDSGVVVCMIFSDWLATDTADETITDECLIPQSIGVIILLCARPCLAIV